MMIAPITNNYSNFSIQKNNVKQNPLRGRELKADTISFGYTHNHNNKEKYPGDGYICQALGWENPSCSIARAMRSANLLKERAKWIHNEVQEEKELFSSKKTEYYKHSYDFNINRGGTSSAFDIMCRLANDDPRISRGEIEPENASITYYEKDKNNYNIRYIHFDEGCIGTCEDIDCVDGKLEYSMSDDYGMRVRLPFSL